MENLKHQELKDLRDSFMNSYVLYYKKFHSFFASQTKNNDSYEIFRSQFISTTQEFKNLVSFMNIDFYDIIIDEIKGLKSIENLFSEESKDNNDFTSVYGIDKPRILFYLDLLSFEKCNERVCEMINDFLFEEGINDTNFYAVYAAAEIVSTHCNEASMETIEKILDFYQKNDDYIDNTVLSNIKVYLDECTNIGAKNFIYSKNYIMGELFKQWSDHNLK